MVSLSYRHTGKRLFDLAASSMALLVLSPILLAVAATIRLTSPGPAFFRQERLGRQARTFSAFKFRTMTHRSRIPDTVAYSGDPSEITRVGAILRRYKLDELPQLLNVLVGDMSIVGPRPQLPVQLKEFDENARQRLLVRPGLTGMAQTHGNTALSWPQRWYYDARYVQDVSFMLDLRLIVRTIGVLFYGEEKYTEIPPLDSSTERPPTDQSQAESTGARYSEINP